MTPQAIITDSARAVHAFIEWVGPTRARSGDYGCQDLGSPIRAQQSWRCLYGKDHGTHAQCV